MSATELIQQVAALPPQERMRFENLFLALENGTRATHLAHPSNWPDFGERLACIYGKKIAPDSQAIVDNGRGER